MPKKRYNGMLEVDEHPVWSPTRLDLAEACMKAYWFQYVKHLKHPIGADVARGKLIHRMIENFWKLDTQTGLLVPGYSCYDAFINCAVRDWKFQFARTGESDGQKIEWAYKGQQWSKKFLGELAEMAGRIYSRYIDEPPRLAAEIDLKAKIQGLKISAKIDELRKGENGEIIVRDHKSGYKKPDSYYLNSNIQMTDYLLCVFIGLQDFNSSVTKIYPDYYGISLKDFFDIAQIEIHHLPEHRLTLEEKAELEKLGVSSEGFKEHKTKLFTAKRTEKSVDDFVLSIRSMEGCLERRDFHPSKGRNCSFCFYRDDCNKYSPEKEHENEYERSMPLFSYGGITNQSFKTPQPKAKARVLQRTFRFKDMIPVGGEKKPEENIK